MVDIVIEGNGIGGKQGWAYVCNSGEITVLKADMEMPQEYEDFKTFGKVRIVWNCRGYEMFPTTELALNTCEGKDQWELSNGVCVLTNSFTLHDALKLIDDSQAPVIRSGEIVAIAEYTTKSAVLKLYRVGRPDVHCSTVASFIPLSEDEMMEVKKNGERWCCK